MKDTVHRKLFVGPMSVSVVNAVKDPELSKKVGIIPSRRQVEYSGGYVNNWTTSTFLNYTEGLVRCRDHSGPLQGDKPDDGLESLFNDCNASNHFEIIHIDPWKKEKDIETASIATSDLVRYCVSHNSNVLFEIGTEQGIRPYSINELDEFLTITERNLGSLFERVLYCVIQGGTGLRGTNNTGKFDPRKCESMVKICHRRNLLAKEHNGDYITDREITKRFELGLDSINIAPELGFNESVSFLEKLTPEQFDVVYSVCYQSKKWKKWFVEGYEPSNDEEKIDLVKSSCHYCFTHPVINSMMKEVAINADNAVELHKRFLFKKLKAVG